MKNDKSRQEKVCGSSKICKSRQRRIFDSVLRKLKAVWLNKVHMLQFRLANWLRKTKRRKNNGIFSENESLFYWRLDEVNETIGNLPDVERFAEFLVGIWEHGGQVQKHSWMERAEQELGIKVSLAKKFVVQVEDVRKVVRKKKNWSSLGINVIQNFWWKKLKSLWGSMAHAFNIIIGDLEQTSTWNGTGRTAMLPKETDISMVNESRSIVCLITIYEIFTSILANYMVEHEQTNDVWDERQMGTMSGVLDTTDHLLVDTCVLEEVKEHHRNLSVVYYDYNVEHVWMDMVFG